MPWKKDDDGNLVLSESGDPIFIYPDQNEAPFNGDVQYAKIAELNGKLAKRKKRIGQFENTIKLFSDAGVDTSNTESIGTFLSTAAKNAELVENFNDSDLVKAEEVEKIRKKEAEKYTARINTQKANYENKLAKQEKELRKKEEAIHESVIRSGFANSEFIRKHTSFPHPDVAYNFFKKQFGVGTNGTGEMYGFLKDEDGEPTFSIKEPSKPASLEEGIEMAVRGHVNKDLFLVPAGGGSGQQSQQRSNSQQSTSTKQPTIVPRTNKSFLDNIEKIAKGEVVRESE